MARDHLVTIVYRRQIDALIPADELFEQRRKLVCRVLRVDTPELGEGYFNDGFQATNNAMKSSTAVAESFWRSAQSAFNVSH